MSHIEYAAVVAHKKCRPASQDAYAVQMPEGEKPFLATIVDGHGHIEAHEIVAAFSTHVAHALQMHANTDPLFSDASAWFHHVQHVVEQKFGTHRVGATAACVSVNMHARTGVVAYVGDCRLHRFSPQAEHATERLTEDHVPEQEQEKARLTACIQAKFLLLQHKNLLIEQNASKMRLHFFDTPHGWSKKSLRATRGFGHPDFRPAFVAEPDIVTFTYASDTPTLFALCSSGGSNIVQHVFSRLTEQFSDPLAIRTTELAEIAHARLAERLRGPKRDTTIIFFRISP